MFMNSTTIDDLARRLSLLVLLLFKGHGIDFSGPSGNVSSKNSSPMNFVEIFLQIFVSIVYFLYLVPVILSFMCSMFNFRWFNDG